jgi:dihydrofolate reductase
VSEKQCRVSLIVAVADNGVIGIDNKIPWKCSSDMKYFRQTTMGKPVIMGRKTWESLGKPLKGRENIVLTRNEDYEAQGASIASSRADALKLAASVTGEKGCEAMIIGGKAIYDEFMGYADRIYYTIVHMHPEGDTFFEKLSGLLQGGWTEVSRQEKTAGERDEADMSFIILEKKP